MKKYSFLLVTGCIKREIAYNLSPLHPRALWIALLLSWRLAVSVVPVS